jgi:hypothetical protein
MFDEQKQAELHARGYTIVELVSGGDAAALLDAVAAQPPLGEFHPATAGKAFQFHSSFLDDDLVYRKRIHEMIKARFQPELDAILRDYEILIAGLFLKQPGSGAVHLHFDWTMIDDLDRVGINVWCPLVDVDETNGALRLVEGSHQLVRHIGAPHARPYFKGYEAELMDASLSVPLRAGQALIYDNTILHWSPVNRSAAPRPVIAMNCLPRTARPVFYRLDAEAGGKRFEVYDMADGGFFEHDAAAYFAGNIRRPSLGFVENPNRIVDRAEFQRRLDRLKRQREGRPGDGDGAAGSWIKRGLQSLLRG